MAIPSTQDASRVRCMIPKSPKWSMIDPNVSAPTTNRMVAVIMPTRGMTQGLTPISLISSICQDVLVFIYTIALAIPHWTSAL